MVRMCGNAGKNSTLYKPLSQLAMNFKLSVPADPRAGEFMI